LSPKDPLAWSGDDHNLYTRFLRYKTAAERAFSNAFKNLEYLRKARYSEAEAQRRLQHQIATLHFHMERDAAKQNLADARFAFEQQKHATAQSEKAATRTVSPSAKKKKNDFDVAEQWMEITVTDGITKTEYVPTSEELLEELEKEGRVPQMIYRRMNFPDGVPPEYAWTNLHDVTICPLTQAGQWCEPCARYLYGGHGMQRMTFDTWKETIAREALTPGQHAGPTGAGNLLRPAERGGDCDYAELLQLADATRYHNAKQPPAPEK
jgi:hypothetical protein